MQGVIVCFGGEFVVIQVGSLRLTYQEKSYVVGTAKYYEKVIDRYIARMLLETEGPIHVFNAYMDDTCTTPAPWAGPLIERLLAFRSIDVIEPPTFHNRSDWITAIPGLRLALDTFDWPERVLVRDGASIITLVQNPEGEHLLHNITHDNNYTDAAAIKQLTQDTSELSNTLKSTFEAIDKSAQSLGVPRPYGVDVDVDTMIQSWCEQNTEPITCATCIALMCDESAAFNPDNLNPLYKLASRLEERASKMVAIVKRDYADTGVGISMDREASDNGFYIISYGVNDLGQLLVPGVEAVLARL
jgi:hypothetical protein